jgi:hypothetical protein
VVDLLKKYRCPDLHRQFDITAVIDHIVKSMLHIGSEMCPVFQHDTYKSITPDGGHYGSRLSRKLVRKSSKSVFGRAAPCESRVSLKVALKRINPEKPIRGVPIPPRLFFHHDFTSNQDMFSVIHDFRKGIFNVRRVHNVDREMP